MDPFNQFEERIQASYKKYQKEPGNPAHSLAIATLYEQREDYATAIPWLETALYLVREKGDSVLEGRILDAQIRALKKDLGQIQAAIQMQPDSEQTPETRVKCQKAVDAKLDELNALLKVQKQRGRAEN